MGVALRRSPDWREGQYGVNRSAGQPRLKHWHLCPGSPRRFQQVRPWRCAPRYALPPVAGTVVQTTCRMGLTTAFLAWCRGRSAASCDRVQRVRRVSDKGRVYHHRAAHSYDSLQRGQVHIRSSDDGSWILGSIKLSVWHRYVQQSIVLQVGMQGTSWQMGIYMPCATIRAGACTG